MKTLNRTNLDAPTYPVRVLQFGGGNFLRAFAGYLIDAYNKKASQDLGIAVVKVTPRGDYSMWKAQDGLYHVRTKGIVSGELVNQTDLIASITQIIYSYTEWDKYIETAKNLDIQFIISNTTESGLSLSNNDKMDATPPGSFPAKLTIWLHERFNYFDGAIKAGCTILPCELLVDNGQLLKALVIETAQKWELSTAFIDWVEQANTFCNTLVDRIVPGVEKEKLPTVWQELGYEDHLVTEGEPYHLWVIEAPDEVAQALPLHEVGLNVVYTDNLELYRKRKVRILNGSHTALVPVGYLYGKRIVRDAINEEPLGNYLSKLLSEEVLPTMNMPQQELQAYVSTVMDRFKNPYIDHYLISISLNSFSKFKSRLLPTALDFITRFDQPPPLISFALAATILFYKGTYKNETIPLNDSPAVLEKLEALWTIHANDLQMIAKEVLSWSDFWGQNLADYNGWTSLVAQFMTEIEAEGMEASLAQLLK